MSLCLKEIKEEEIKEGEKVDPEPVTEETKKVPVDNMERTSKKSRLTSPYSTPEERE